MKLYNKIMTKYLENPSFNIMVPVFEVDAEKIVNNICYNALQQIKQIIENPKL